MIQFLIINFKIFLAITMSVQRESFGIMDEGYFVPRSQIIDWINQLLDLNITKIQQLGSGSVYCQIVDIIHPGKVTMNKVNWRAKNDYEFINNLKILQSAFEKVGVKRYVEVEKLAKAKYQDNLQFIQWLKRYYDLNCGGGKDYDPKQKRGNCPVDFSFAEKNVVPKTYNGSGQIIGTSKPEIPQKKSTNVVHSNRLALLETKPNNKRDHSQSPGRMDRKRQENKGGKSKGPLQAKQKSEDERTRELGKIFEMIQEVLGSNENSDMKLAMIEEIMNFQKVEKKKRFNEMTNQDEEENI